jgi:hypothetical protein
MTQQTDTDTAVQESVDYKIKDINLAEFGKKRSGNCPARDAGSNGHARKVCSREAP